MSWFLVLAPVAPVVRRVAYPIPLVSFVPLGVRLAHVRGYAAISQAKEAQDATPM